MHDWPVAAPLAVASCSPAAMRPSGRPAEDDCHGADGNAPIDPSYPKLGGQYADYLAHALQGYRSGDRENALMASQARELSDQQVADLAAYFGSRPTELTNLAGAHDAD